MTRISRRVLPALALALASPACSPAPRPAPAPPAGRIDIVLDSLLYLWVQASADGGWVARMIIPGDDPCPSYTSLRAAPDSTFPVTVCEMPDLPPLAEVRVAGRRLATFPPNITRVVVIGDTGCQYAEQQQCADPAWPFATVAAAAADSNPNIVVHVGDYLYREKCEKHEEGGCADDWGGWQADFFAPAAPLLARSPWIFTRGNHEQCERGALGWFRFLDPRPFMGDTACAEITDPYAVPVPGVGRILIFDTACAPKEGTGCTNLGLNSLDSLYARQFTLAADSLAAGSTPTWLATHAPVWGWRDGTSEDSVGTAVLDSALTLSLRGQFPPSISLLLHGHIHVWEAIGFASGRPPVIVAGNGGTVIEKVKLPFPSAIRGVGLTTRAMSYQWGFTLLTASAGGWAATMVTPLNPDSTRRCTITRRQISC